MSSSSVAPFSVARPRWNTSWSVLPPVVNAATVTRLRSLADSCGRVQTWPNRTSSVKPTSAGAKSPNILSAPEGSLRSVSSAMSVVLSVTRSAMCVWGHRRTGGESAGSQPQRCRGRVRADHRVDVGAAVAGVLAPVGLVDRSLVGVGGLFEGDVALDTPGPDPALMAVQHVAEPASAASPVGAHVQVVADPHHPDRRVGMQGPVPAQGRDL